MNGHAISMNEILGQLTIDRDTVQNNIKEPLIDEAFEFFLHQQMETLSEIINLVYKILKTRDEYEGEGEEDDNVTIHDI